MIKYFAMPISKDRFTPTSSLLSFPTFSQQQEQACSAVNDTGQRARQEEERTAVESVKCLIEICNGGRHLTYPNMCVGHECRIRKHFLIKCGVFNKIPHDFLAKSSQECS